MSKRNLWMDMLNITACFFVLVLHVSNHAIHDFSGTISAESLWGMITHSFFLWPVPIFLMISGANIISVQGSYKEFFKKRFKKTGIPFVVWSFIYAFLTKPSFDNWQDYVSTFLNGHYNYHMWFFIPLFALYFSVPFFKAMLDNLSKRLLYILVFFSFIFNSIIPYCMGIFHITKMNYALFPITSNLLMYGILGYLIEKKDFFIQQKKTIFILTVSSIIISFVFLYLGMLNGDSSKTYTTYNSPFLFIISIGVFIAFKEFNWERLVSKLKITPNIITSISQCSFGIYLSHQIFRRISDHYHLVVTNPYYGAFLLYVISLVFVIFLKKTPFLKRIVP